MDVQMPEMDGLTATGEIRSRERIGAAPFERHMPIIAMTAHAMTGDKERCIDAGMDDYVTKPINRQLLREALQRHLPIVIQSPEQNVATNADDTTKSASVISMHRLDIACGGDTEFMQELLSDFLRIAPDYIARIDGAASKSDSTALLQASHALKGSCRALGCDALGQVCQALEHSASPDIFNSQSSALLVSRLHKEFLDLKNRLNEMISQQAA
jgi:HPt (histidine-containing phosphotransfer) domain-containing protein